MILETLSLNVYYKISKRKKIVCNLSAKFQRKKRKRAIKTKWKIFNKFWKIIFTTLRTRSRIGSSDPHQVQRSSSCLGQIVVVVAIAVVVVVVVVVVHGG